jgi:hypothetical protein
MFEVGNFKSSTVESNQLRHGPALTHHRLSSILARNYHFKITFGIQASI